MQGRSNWAQLDSAALDMHQLSAADICLLQETEDEWARRGHWQSVWPDPNMSKCGKFFESQRWSDHLLAKWVSLDSKERRAKLNEVMQHLHQCSSD